MLASALLLFRSCRLDDLIDLARSEAVGFVALGLIAYHCENLRLRRGKFDIIADIQKNGGRIPRETCSPTLNAELTQMMIQMLIHQRRPFRWSQRAKKEVRMLRAYPRPTRCKAVNRLE